MKQKEILISIVIPVKNGDYWLDETLQAIKSQSLFHCTEIIAIDSGSTDTSLEVLAKHNVQIIQIDPKTFNHGLTRNIGVSAAQGEFIVMTVQDAKPVDEFWLQHLLNSFDDNSVAGVCGQQIVPHDLDKNPIEWFRPQSPPAIWKHYFPNFEAFEKLSPSEKKRVCGWDNVTAMYRKEALLKVPFQATTFAEDALWSRDALRSGYSIVYNNHAKVYHYHLSDPDFVVKRQFTVFYHFYQYFKFTPSYSTRTEVRRFISSLKTLLFINELTLREKAQWLLYNWKLRRNIKKAISLFYENLKLGEETLTKKHLEICGNAPSAIVPNTRVQH